MNLFVGRRARKLLPEGKLGDLYRTRRVPATARGGQGAEGEDRRKRVKGKEKEERFARIDLMKGPSLIEW